VFYVLRIFRDAAPQTSESGMNGVVFYIKCDTLVIFPSSSQSTYSLPSHWRVMTIETRCGDLESECIGSNVNHDEPVCIVGVIAILRSARMHNTTERMNEIFMKFE
jgi:hypothetical protein